MRQWSLILVVLLWFVGQHRVVVDVVRHATPAERDDPYTKSCVDALQAIMQEVARIAREDPEVELKRWVD